MTTTTISDIKTFVKNIKHEGDYFLITSDSLKFWVKDPEKKLLESKSNIKSLECVLKGVHNTKSKKHNQYMEIIRVNWDNGGEEIETETGIQTQLPPRPDYTGWTDEEIAADILARRSLEEKLNGNSFVKFREAVVKSQKVRHEQLVKSLKAAKRGRKTEDFEDIDIDPDYMKDLLKEAKNLESRLGRSVMIGDGAGRLDALPAYDMKHDTTWGMPSQVD